MVKTVFKEIFIVMLILIAIVLTLGIILYDYIPINKVAPSKVEAYTLTQDMENELKETLSTTTQNIIKTYYIDSSDLQIYEKQNEYDKGKANPFEAIESSEINNNTNKTNTVSSGNSTNNDTNTSSKGFFNTTGK